MVEHREALRITPVEHLDRAAVGSGGVEGRSPGQHITSQVTIRPRTGTFCVIREHPPVLSLNMRLDASVDGPRWGQLGVSVVGVVRRPAVSVGLVVVLLATVLVVALGFRARGADVDRCDRFAADSHARAAPTAAAASASWSSATRGRPAWA